MKKKQPKFINKCPICNKMVYDDTNNNGKWQIECSCGYSLLDDDINNLIRIHNQLYIAQKLASLIDFIHCPAPDDKGQMLLHVDIKKRVAVSTVHKLLEQLRDNFGTSVMVEE